MFSTAAAPPRRKAADNIFFVPIACGVDSSMSIGPNQTYPQSTGPTPPATLLYL